MFCTKCGSQLNENGVCPVCGPASAPVYAPEAGSPTASAEGKLKAAFSGTLFLVMAILTTASAVLSFLNSASGGIFSFGIINILFIIAMWMLFATARSAEKPLSRGAMKLAHGTSIALYVIGWVIFGLLVFLAICFFIVSAANISADLLYTLFYSITEALPGVFSYALSGIFSFLGIILVLVAVIVALVTVFFYGSLKKFTRSVRDSADTGIMNIQKAKTVRVWFLVLGIIDAVEAVSGLITISYTGALPALATACTAAAYIIAYVWAGQYFADITNRNL